MAKIKVLSAQEICKIAAGEVVERPANIVKELVENSIDAGATKIEIYLTAAGKQTIRVLDNGCGMSGEDAILCFAHHATSKISTVSDLAQLASFGFRGEALSSIAAVSKISLNSCDAGALMGTKTILEGGVLLSQVASSFHVGTDITISDLFYNVPARQKFLKKEETEWRQILQLFQAFVFDYPQISFKLYHDQKLVYNCPAVSLLVDRVVQLWDTALADRMLELKELKQGSVTLTGLICDHQTFRYNRTQVFCFVNRRLIKNYSIVKAILNGYSNVLPAGRYPVAILFIDLPNEQVDINVHPRKEEVSFLNPRKIESLITSSIKTILEQKITTHIATPQMFKQPSFAATSYPSQDNYFKAAQIANSLEDLQPSRFAEPIMRPSSEQRFAQILNQADFKQTNFVARDYEIVGQFKKTYIIISNQAGLSLIDQHAAHERVLYEQFKSNFHEVAKIKLIFPVIINLSQSDLIVIEPYLPILNQHGLETDLFGANQLMISATPTFLKQANLQELILELISWINEQQTLDQAALIKLLNERIHAQMACKAAIKAGDILTNLQMYELLDNLAKSQNRLTCPHGRPTTWSFGLAELEKKFKRRA